LKYNGIIFACRNTKDMENKTIVRRQVSFRLRADLLERLKRNAALQNRSLNSYVESILLNVVYNDPNLFATNE